MPELEADTAKLRQALDLISSEVLIGLELECDSLIPVYYEGRSIDVATSRKAEVDLVPSSQIRKLNGGEHLIYLR